MPNHITNIITFSEETLPDRIREILEAIKNDDVGIGSIDFNKIIPMPEHIFRGNLGSEEFEKYGKNNWYDWSVEFWGTKWLAFDFKEYNGENITFHTAWSPPHPVIQKLSEMYPDIYIQHQWADEDFGFNVGECYYRNGEVLSDFIPEGGTKQAYEMAGEILGYEPEELGFRLSEDGTSYEYVDEEDEQIAQTLQM